MQIFAPKTGSKRLASETTQTRRCESTPRQFPCLIYSSVVCNFDEFLTRCITTAKSTPSYTALRHEFVQVGHIRGRLAFGNHTLFRKGLGLVPRQYFRARAKNRLGMRLRGKGGWPARPNPKWSLLAKAFYKDLQLKWATKITTDLQTWFVLTTTRVQLGVQVG